MLQLDAAQRSSAQLSASSSSSTASPLLSAQTNSTRQRLDSSSAPTASQRNGSLGLPGITISASARQSLLRRSARSRSRSTISISILIHPLTHSPTHHSLNLPALLGSPRTLILLQGLASSFVTSASARSSPFSAAPTWLHSPSRPDLIALTCSSTAPAPRPALTVQPGLHHVHAPDRRRCRAVPCCRRTARAVPHSPTSSSDAHPWPLHPTQPRPDHLDPHSPHCLLVISSTSQLLGFLIRLSFNPPIQLATIRPPPSFTFTTTSFSPNIIHTYSRRKLSPRVDARCLSRPRHSFPQHPLHQLPAQLHPPPPIAPVVAPISLKRRAIGTTTLPPSRIDLPVRPFSSCIGEKHRPSRR